MRITFLIRKIPCFHFSKLNLEFTVYVKIGNFERVKEKFKFQKKNQLKEKEILILSTLSNLNEKFVFQGFLDLFWFNNQFQIF